MKTILKIFITIISYLGALTNADLSGCQFSFISTLGQLCKTADFVAKSKLIQIDKGNAPHSILTFEIIEIIDGIPPISPENLFKVKIESVDGIQVYNEYLIFGSKKYFPVVDGSTVNYSQFMFDFRRENSGKKMNEWNIIGYDRGIIPLKSEQDALLLTKIIHDYWIRLRGTDRSREEYEEFLKGLLKNNNNRVNSDAALDLRTLIRISEVNDLKRMSNDDGLPQEFRDYAVKRLNIKTTKNH